MALLDDIENTLGGRNIMTGLAIGLGATILAPLVIPVVASVAKPLAKAVIKSGFILYEKSREVVAEAGEVIEDLMAEAKAELAEANRETSFGAPSGQEKQL
jgi:hypothetical protein